MGKKYKVKYTAVVPVMQYGNLQPSVEIEGDNYEELEKEGMNRIKAFWDSFGENKFPAKEESGFIERQTFTGETILYNEATHTYKTIDGDIMVSASQFKKKFEKPFDKARILPLMEKKYGVKAELVDDMWTRNSLISTTFGTALHLAMEQWFKHKENGTENNYHLPKHPFLRSAVESFPDKDKKIIPELMVSCVEKKMAGQIDGIEVRKVGKGQVITIIDYKTDADVKKNLKGHFIQMSFYAEILKSFGFKVDKVRVWNFTDKWEKYDSEVININEL